jgi:DNA-binding CsgD family transcriptional regulator
MVQIRNAACAAVVVLAVIASPLLAFAAPLVSCMYPTYTGPERFETAASCMANCPMMAQVNSAFRREPISRSSACHPNPCSSASQQGTQGMLGLNGKVSGIRRIYPKNVLDHTQRKAIYDVIVTKPGIDIKRIGNILNLNRETLRYHLDLLEASNKIVVMKDHGIRRYYENHGRYAILEKRIMAHQWNPTAGRIISIVQSNQGITQGDIAIRLSITSPTVHWYMQRLTTDGIITALHMSRLTHYHITEEALQVLTKGTHMSDLYQNNQQKVFQHN